MLEKNKNRILYLDGLRAIAAVYVTIHHIAIQYPNSCTHSHLVRLLFAPFLRGNYAVDLFIVLSGYCLMLPLVKAGFQGKFSTWIFFERRAKRILPTYYLAMLLSMLLIWLFIGGHPNNFWQAALPLSYSAFLTHVFLIHDIFYSTAFKINYAFWSISVESRIYLLFPFLILIWRKVGAGYALLFSCIVSVAIYIFSGTGWATQIDFADKLSGINPYLVLFTLGMLAAAIANMQGDHLLSQYRKQLPWGYISTFLFCFMLFCDHLNAKGTVSNHLMNIPVGLFASSLLVGLAKPKHEGNRCQWLLNLLSWQPLVFIGTFAYSIYLIHAPFIQLILQYVLLPLGFSDLKNTVLLLIIGLPAIIFLCYLFFLAAEKPFLSTKSEKSKKSLEQETAINPAP